MSNDVEQSAPGDRPTAPWARTIQQEMLDHARPQFLVGSPDDEGLACFDLFGHELRGDAEDEATQHERRKPAGASWYSVVYRMTPVTRVQRQANGVILLVPLDGFAARLAQARARLKAFARRLRRTYRPRDRRRRGS